MSKSIVLCAIGSLLLCGAPVAFAGEGAKIVVNGSAIVGPIAEVFAESYMGLHPGVNVIVFESGSGNGAKSLIHGACDIATMSRPMKDEEIKAAEEKNVKPVAHIIAWDAIAIVVHPSNPVNARSLDQVRDSYRGAITSWVQVGGSAGAISRYTGVMTNFALVGGPGGAITRISGERTSGTYEIYEEKSGTYGTFEAKVMRGERIGAVVEYLSSCGAVRARVGSTPMVIGYLSLGCVGPTMKALAIDGVEPSTKTVLSGKYPIARPFFLYTNGEPKEGSALAAFLNFYKTPKGRDLVEAAGFVAIPEPPAK